MIIAILILIILKISNNNEIPTGKRSMKRFTRVIKHEEEISPPIKSYSDKWTGTIDRMGNKKSYGTLTSRKSNKRENSKGSLNDNGLLTHNGSDKDNLIQNLNEEDDKIITEAENFAKSFGLLNKEWRARKDHIPTREDELEIFEGNMIVVYELYDDFWCYGTNLDHYGTLNNDNMGMFPSSILPLEIVTNILQHANSKNSTSTNATAVNSNANNSDDHVIQVDEEEKVEEEEKENEEVQKIDIKEISMEQQKKEQMEEVDKKNELKINTKKMSQDYHHDEAITPVDIQAENSYVIFASPTSNANGLNQPFLNNNRHYFNGNESMLQSPGNDHEVKQFSIYSSQKNHPVVVNQYGQPVNHQFNLPIPVKETVNLMPPKPLPSIPNLNRSSSLRSSIHRHNSHQSFRGNNNNENKK